MGGNLTNQPQNPQRTHTKTPSQKIPQPTKKPLPTSKEILKKNQTQKPPLLNRKPEHDQQRQSLWNLFSKNLSRSTQ